MKDYGEEKILELVKQHRSRKQEEATGIGAEGKIVCRNREYMGRLGIPERHLSKQSRRPAMKSQP